MKNNKSYALKALVVSIFIVCLITVGCRLGTDYGDNGFFPSGKLSSLKGKILIPASPANLKAQNLSGLVSAVGAEVWLEDLPDFPHVYTNASGVYTFENLPPGDHIVVAKFVVNNVIQKAKSTAITVTGDEGTADAPDVQLAEAKNILTGTLKDSSGNPLPPGTELSLWGESFTVGLDGTFTTPPLPDGINTAEIKVDVPGSQDQTSFVGTFVEGTTPAYIEQEILPAASANKAPSGVLIAKNMAGEETVKCKTNDQLNLYLTPYDPNSEDLDQLSFSWSATNGELEVNSNGKEATWKAMAEPSVATVSVVITDPHDATSKVNLRLLVDVATMDQVDSIGPRIVSKSPSPDATSVAINTPIEVLFDEPVRSNSISSNTITVFANETELPGQVILDTDQKTVVWAPDSPIPYNTKITANVSGEVRDELGNPSGKTTSWNFTTIAPPATDPFAPAGVPDGVAFVTAAVPTKTITSFAFENFTPSANGIIDEVNHKIIVLVPYGTNLTSLTPTIVHDGISISPMSGVANNFSSPTNYTVMASDGTTQNYEVTVTISSLPTKVITSFNFNSLSPAAIGDIDENAKTITFNLPYGTNVTSLVPTIAHSGVSVNPGSGVARNFSSPVTYTVTATNGSTQDYQVSVNVGQYDSRDLIKFEFREFSPPIIGEITQKEIFGWVFETNVNVSVPFGTDITNLKPFIVHNGVSVTPNSGAARSFTNPVTYQISAANGGNTAFTVTVGVGPSPNKTITKFDVEHTSPKIYGEIDEGQRKITLTVPSGTDVSNLTPTIIHTGASISPASGVAQNFNNPVNYTVIAQDGTTETFQVTAKNPEWWDSEINAFVFESFDPDIKGDINNTSISVSVPYGTDVTSLVPTISIIGNSVSPNTGVAQNFTNPVSYTVQGTFISKTYQVTVTVEPNNFKEITSFNFEGLNPTITGIVDETQKKVLLTVPHGTDPSSLVPTITHTGTNISPSSGVAQNFSNPVVYMTTGADGSTKYYEVIVIVEASTEKDITSFRLNGLNPQIDGTINQTNKTIALRVPYGTSLGNLVPTIAHTGVSMSPASGVAQNFSSPVTYTVTAENGSVSQYEVTVTADLSDSKVMTGFSFNGLSPSVMGIINESAKTVTLTVPYDTDIINLVPTIAHTGASISPDTGVANNFTNPVVYTVTAEDASTQAYTVTVNVLPSPLKDITSFKFTSFTPNVSGAINQGTKKISITVPYGSDITNLAPTIAHTGASISPNSGIARNFTSAQNYTVTAEDGSTQVYQVNVTIALNPAKEVQTITFGNSGAVAPINVEINETARTIKVTVPKGTDISAIPMEIEHTGVSINPESGSVQDFTNPVVYIVTAEDSTTKDYEVSADEDITPSDYSSPNVGALKAIIGNEFDRDENPSNKSRVTTFRMSKYEVTQAQYQAIMGYNPSWCVVPNVATTNLNKPVEKVTWFDAIEFCNKLSQSEGLPLAYEITGRTPASGYPITDATVTLTGQNGYRLPTEAEWQWAFMGGQNARNKQFAGDNGSNEIASYAWYYDNCMNALIPTDEDYGTHPVGSLLPNEFGLYDLSGNVAEWCWDIYDNYPAGQLQDPTGSSSGTYRIIRGGSWMSKIKHAQAGFRRYFYPGKKIRLLRYQSSQKLV